MKLYMALPIVAIVPTLAFPASPFAVRTPLEVREVREAASVQLESTSRLVGRQSCAETCGKVCYYQSTIDEAVSAGYKLYQQKKQEGDYPHLYNNYEGFDFGVPGPYQEYPIMSDFKAYDGDSPGADRVIFNTNGTLAGTITHSGASGDDFVACKN